MSDLDYPTFDVLGRMIPLAEDRPQVEFAFKLLKTFDTLGEALDFKKQIESQGYLQCQINERMAEVSN